MNNEISVKDLISSIKKKGLLQSIPQLEQIYQFAIEVEKKLAESEAKCVQLAAENVAAKKIISECREYFIAGVMNRIRPTNEGYLHMICDTFADETPATDRIVAGIKADGVEEFVSNTVHKIFDESEAVSALAYLSLANSHVKLLREGADK